MSTCSACRVVDLCLHSHQLLTQTSTAPVMMLHHLIML